MSIIATALSLITALIKGWLGGKDEGQKAIKTVIDERNEALDNVRKANKAVNRLRTDDKYASELQQRFTRPEDN